jgi:hypothetical protein
VAQNKSFRFGPVAMANGTYVTNILNCTITSLAGVVGFTATQPYVLIKKLHIVNITSGALTFRLYIGATGANAAGTNVFGFDLSVAANSFVESIDLLRLDAADFLVGGASGAGLVIMGEGEIGFS